MALSTEQLAALALLATADVKDVADGLKEHAQPAYQAVFARGFGQHKQDSKAETDRLNEQIATLTTERDEARTERDEAGTKDTAAADRIARLETALSDEKNGRKTDAAAAADRLKSVFAAREDAALVADLVAQGVDREWAELVVAPKAAARRRIGDVGEDGTVQIDYLDADGLTPLQAGRPALVTDLVKGIDARHIVSNADSGSGRSGGQGGNGGGGYDPVAAGKQMAKDQMPTEESNALR